MEGKERIELLIKFCETKITTKEQQEAIGKKLQEAIKTPITYEESGEILIHVLKNNRLTIGKERVID